MEDLISRQAAIDSTWKALFEYEDKMEESYQDPEDLSEWIMKKRPWVQKGHDLCLKALLEEPSADRPRWIPCSKGLPMYDETSEYLVTDRDGRLRHCYLDPYMPETFVTVEEGMIVDAVAWRPAPEPYCKTESHEREGE